MGLSAVVRSDSSAGAVCDKGFKAFKVPALRFKALTKL